MRPILPQSHQHHSCAGRPANNLRPEWHFLRFLKSKMPKPFGQILKKVAEFVPQKSTVKMNGQ
jgi:hypothetical protein